VILCTTMHGQRRHDAYEDDGSDGSDDRKIGGKIGNEIFHGDISRAKVELRTTIPAPIPRAFPNPPEGFF